jgi:hypothetical protein
MCSRILLKPLPILFNSKKTTIAYSRPFFSSFAYSWREIQTESLFLLDISLMPILINFLSLLSPKFAYVKTFQRGILDWILELTIKQIVTKVDNFATMTFP